MSKRLSLCNITPPVEQIFKHDSSDNDDAPIFNIMHFD